jgi:hypothetical protein
VAAIVRRLDEWEEIGIDREAAHKPARLHR